MPEDTAAAEFPDDTELLDWLQSQLDRSRYSGKVECVLSGVGKGVMLVETIALNAGKDIRRAIADAMERNSTVGTF